MATGALAKAAERAAKGVARGSYSDDTVSKHSMRDAVNSACVLALTALENRAANMTNVNWGGIQWMRKKEKRKKKDTRSEKEEIEVLRYGEKELDGYSRRRWWRDEFFFPASLGKAATGAVSGRP